MEGRNLQIRRLSWMSSILLFAVIVLANIVFARSATRIDLTEEGVYTLTDGSKRILAGLEDPAIIKVFWQGIPARFDNTKRYVEALLDEMENAASDERFQVQWVDMEEEEGKSAASELGVEQYVFGAAHGSEVRESKGYMSLTIELGNEKPAIFNALSLIEDQLEYLIVATIYQRSRTERPVIGMVAPRPQFNPFMGGRRPQGQFNDFGETMRKAFGNAARDYLTLDQPIEPDVEVLILTRPRALTETQVYHFEQFLLRGGRGILLLDPVDIDNVFGAASQRAEPHLSGMEDWLSHVGVTAERGVVGDFEATCLFPKGGREAVRYPFWPKVLPDFMDRENPVTRNLAPMPMYWPAALSVDEKKQTAEGRTATVLATTSDSGYRRGDITALKDTAEDASGKLLERVPLIVMVEGPLKSLWLGKPVPGSEPEKPADGEGGSEDGEGSGDGAPAAGSPDGDAPADPPKSDEPKKDDAPEGGEPKEAPKADEPKKDPGKDEPKQDGSDGDGDADAKEDEESGPARLEDGEIKLLVVGDAELICDQLGPRFPFSRAINGVTGFSFVANAAEWMSGSDDLLALRARATNPRNLEQMEDKDRDLVKNLNLYLIPLLVLLAGMTVFIVRRS